MSDDADELERFLSDEFYAVIYPDVVSHGYSPLAFFKRLDNLFRFIETHRESVMKFPYPIDNRLSKEESQAAPISIVSQEYYSYLLDYAYLLCQLHWLIKYKIETNGVSVDKYWRMCSGMVETRAGSACWHYLQHPGSRLPVPDCRASFGQSKPTEPGGHTTIGKIAFIKMMADSPAIETQKAFSYLIETGRKVYASGKFSKHLVARECKGRHGISAEGPDCVGNCHGCKAIDRLIKKYNSKWNWRLNTLPLIKKIRI